MPAAETVPADITERAEMFPVERGPALRLFRVPRVERGPFSREIGAGGLNPRIQRFFHYRLALFEQGQPRLNTLERKVCQIRRLRREPLPGAMRGHQVPRNQSGILNPTFRQLRPDERLQFPQTLLCSLVHRRKTGIAHHHSRTGQDAVEGVIVGCRNGVELVVMAAGAGDGEALKRLAQSVDLVIDDVRANLPERNAIVVAELAEPQGSGSNYRFV